MRMTYSMSLFLCTPLLVVSCRSDNEQPQAPLKNPGFIEIVGLADKSSKTYSTSLPAPDGTKWYVSSTPTLNGNDLEFGSAKTERVEKGYAVTIPVLRKSRARWAEWTNKHRGEHEGVLLDGRLVREEEVLGGGVHSLYLFGYSTQEAAEEVASWIRSGGRKASSSGPG